MSLLLLPFEVAFLKLSFSLSSASIYGAFQWPSTTGPHYVTYYVQGFATTTWVLILLIAALICVGASMQSGSEESLGEETRKSVPPHESY
jgi:methyl coenzyme M reductase beta subunit